MQTNLYIADLATVGLLVVLESLLSADNALVMAVMVSRLPEGVQRRALNYGLVGALTLRVVATALGIYLIQAAWLKLFGGSYLLYLSAAHALQSVGWAQKATPGTTLGSAAPGLWTTVIRVELVNVAFSVDSILVAVGMSTKLWVVLAGGLLGLIAIRVIVAQLVRIIRRYPRLVHGAFVIVAWIGVKLLLDYARQMRWVSWTVPQTISLSVVLAILLGSYLLARRMPAEAGESSTR